MAVPLTTTAAEPEDARPATSPKATPATARHLTTRPLPRAARQVPGMAMDIAMRYAHRQTSRRTGSRPHGGCRFHRVSFVLAATIPNKEVAMKYILLIHQGVPRRPGIRAPGTSSRKRSKKAVYAEYMAISNDPRGDLGRAARRPGHRHHGARRRTAGRSPPTGRSPSQGGDRRILGARGRRPRRCDRVAARIPAAGMGGAVEVRPIVEM